MPENMRTASIRVAAENFTKNGLIIYEESDIIRKIETLSAGKSNFRYSYILHDKDTCSDTESPVTPHYHIVMKFEETEKWKRIKALFPYGDIRTAGTIKRATRYQLHLDHPEKFPYSKAEIRTNYSPEELDKILSPIKQANKKKKTSMDSDVALNKIVEGILSGKIRKYNLYKFATPQFLGKSSNAKVIEYAFDQYELTFPKEKYVHVIFICGKTGSGKSTLAKMIAEKKGDGSSFDAGSSNDPLNKYRGENTLIFNDLRDTSFLYQDFLKIIDPYNRSAIKSRYQNKLFLGECIIITSSVDIEEWYPDIEEDFSQCRRRIAEHIELTSKEMLVSEYVRQEDESYIKVPVKTTVNPTVGFIEASKIDKPQVASVVELLGLEGEAK